MLRSLFLIFFSASLAGTLHGQHLRNAEKPLTGIAIEDFLLGKLSSNKILVIPECLSHDSYDAIRLPVAMIKRWLVNNHGIKKLVVGLEQETMDSLFFAIRNNQYHEVERIATICPSQWSSYSTKRLNENLFFSNVLDRTEGSFRMFGFENSSEYYDEHQHRYLLPSQIDTALGPIKEIPFNESEAPFVLKYSYSRFFRDYRSFVSIQREIERQPDACFLIIIGNGHTFEKWQFDETDQQIIRAYGIDTVKYTHTVGYYLKKYYSPLFIHSRVDSFIKEYTLFPFNPLSSDSALFRRFLVDYHYGIPSTEDANIEEPPLVAVPSANNLILLAEKRFQFYSDAEHSAVAKRLVYLFTGIVPDIKQESPGTTGPCLFLDPKTQQVIDLASYANSVTAWYRDGTFVRRLTTDLAGYNHRLLYQGIFRLMHKKTFDSISADEARDFTNHLLAVLSVIGTDSEREMSRGILTKQFGQSKDYYWYYKKYYFKQYE